MTLPGGPANKLGNRYEKWWTLPELVHMLQGDTEAVRIEPPASTRRNSSQRPVLTRNCSSFQGPACWVRRFGR